MQRWRFEEYVEGPVRELARDLAPSTVLTDVASPVALAVEMLCRLAVPEQWEGWRGQTTDGAVVDLAWWTSESTVAVAARVWIDFTGHVAPVMVVFALDERRLQARVHVGSVDPLTVGVPSLPADWLILQGGHGEDGVVPHVTEGRRLVALEWTEVAVVGSDDLED